MTQADSENITAMSGDSPARPYIPTDDEIGMAWWNALSERERERWSAVAGNTGRAKDAWEAFKRANLERPAESAGGLYYPTPVTPEEVFQAIGRLRKEARAEIDRLIRFLDKTDDYVSRELEDDDDREQVGDDEPSLGSFDRMTNQDKAWRQQSLWAFPAVDAEQDDADREDDDPREDDRCA
jgi:hypothetical protein